VPDPVIKTFFIVVSRLAQVDKIKATGSFRMMAGTAT
jgi:hypothetical protein